MAGYEQWGCPLVYPFPITPFPSHPTASVFRRLDTDAVQKAPPGGESGESPLPKDTSCTVVCKLKSAYIRDCIS